MFCHFVFYQRSTIRTYCFDDNEFEEVLDDIARIWKVRPAVGQTGGIWGLFEHIRKKRPVYRTAFVGLFWLYEDVILGSFCRPWNAYAYGPHLGPFRSFEMAWPVVSEAAPELIDTAADALPRGRVLYDVEADRFVIVAEEEIVGNSETIARIRSAFRIPADHEVTLTTDPCFGPFPTDFLIRPTPIACWNGRCSGARPRLSARGVVEVPSTFDGPHILVKRPCQ